MSDHEVLIFGSFTEEETRFFQEQFTKINVHDVEKTRLQFSYLDLVSLDAERRHKSENTQVSKVFTEVRVSENGKLGIAKDADKVQQSQISCSGNGSFSHNQWGEDENNDFDRSLFRNAEETNNNGDSLTSKSNNERYGKSASSDTSVNSSSLTSVEDVRISGKQEMLLKVLMPRGLINSGNLCFLNATLQALLSCSPFVHLLQDLRDQNVPQVGYPTLQAFVEFILNFEMPKDSSSRISKAAALECGKPFCPYMFDHVLKKFAPDLPAGLSGRPRQEDAQEFLSFVMDQMHDELLKFQGPLLNQNGLNSVLISSAEDDGWETVGPKNKSAVTRTQKFMPSQLSAIFGGQLRSVVKAKGNKASATVQPFLLLHLDIHLETIQTIQDALHLFSAPETLEGYKTSGGKSGQVAASKSVKIEELSKIMILHLKRFSYGSKGMAKLHKPVHFPLELVLGRELLVFPLMEGRRYELVATITHHGREPSRGHYTADAKYSDGQWLRYDDASVKVVDTSMVLHDQAYVLFYKQV